MQEWPAFSSFSLILFCFFFGIPPGSAVAETTSAPIDFYRVSPHLQLTAFELSEDGRQFFVVEKGKPVIQVWETAGRRMLREIACESPQVLLYRKPHLYVLIRDAGLVKVFDPSTGEQTNELVHDLKKAFAMVAAKGEAFARESRLFLSSYPATRLDHRRFGMLQVDRDEFTQFNTPSSNSRAMLHVGRDGRQGVLQLDLESKNAMGCMSISLPQVLESKDLNLPVHKTTLPAQPRVQQLGTSSWWVGSSQILVPQRSGSQMFGERQVRVPEESGAFLLHLTPERIRVEGLRSDLPVLHEMSYELPEGLEVSGCIDWRKGQHGPTFPLHRAVTIDDDLHLFLVHRYTAPGIQGFTLLHGKAPRPDVTLPPVDLKTGGMHLLPLPGPCSHMTWSEDRQRLYFAFRDRNEILVWDPGRKTLIRRIETPRPAMMLERKGSLFVLRDADKIAQINPMTGKLKADIRDLPDDIFFMSAPMGEHYRDRILLSAGIPDCAYIVLDLAKPRWDYYAETKQGGTHQISADGNYIVMQNNAALNPGGYVCSIESSYISLSSQNKNWHIYEGNKEFTPPIYQVTDEPYWFGGNLILRGMPPMRVGAPRGNRVVPDISRPFFYELHNTNVVVRARAGDLVELGQLPLAQPMPTRPKSYHNPLLQEERFPQSPSIGLTTNREVHLYHLVPESGMIYYGIWDEEAAQALPTPATASALQPTWGWSEETIRYAVFDPPSNGTFTIMNGPEGARVDEKGIVTWTPTRAEEGTHPFKLRSNLNDKVAFHRFVLKIRPRPEDQSALAWMDSSPMAVEAGLHRFDFSPRELARLPGQEGMVAVDGRNLIWLDASGSKILRKSLAPQASRIFYVSEKHLVYAVSRTVYICDRTEHKQLRSFTFPRDVKALLSVPGTGKCLISLDWSDEDDENLRDGYKQLYSLDEETGARQVLEGWSADDLLISQDGSTLVGSLNLILGTYFSRDPFLGLPRTTVISKQLLVTARIDRDLNLHGLMVDAYPGNNLVIRLSPTGKELVMFAEKGFDNTVADLHSQDAAYVSSLDLLEVGGTFDPVPFPHDADYHPRYNMTASVNANGLLFLAREPVQQVKNCVMAPMPPGQYVRCRFSPDGSHILLFAIATGVTTLHALPLDLEAIGKQCKPHPAWSMPSIAELKEGAQSFGQQSLQPPEPLMADQIKRMTTPKSDTLKAPELSRKYQHATVLLKTSGGTGTGFFISEKGHLLTCQHVLEPGEAPEIIYTDAKGKTQRTTGFVLQANAGLDAALVAIRPVSTVQAVQFETEKKPGMGEAAFIIGNPGMGDTVLERTMTEGIISSTSRRFAGQTFLQTSAAVNPGSSGSPLYNVRGNVVGMVAQKANIEGAGFAIPTDALIKFLKDVSGDEDDGPSTE